MKNKMEAILAVIVVACLSGGCAGTKSEAGIGLGALTGGALAYGLAQDSSKKELWTVLGIGLGAMIGQNIGTQLDEKDRLLAAQSFEHTMETVPTNEVGVWDNPNSGNMGSFTPKTTVILESGQPCREFTQVVYIGGNPASAHGTACRQADGSWKIQQ